MLSRVFRTVGALHPRQAKAAATFRIAATRGCDINNGAFVQWRSAHTSSTKPATMRDALARHPEAQSVFSTSLQTPVLDALRQTQQENNKALLVVDDAGSVCGIFTESDVMFRNDKMADLKDLVVADVMTSQVVCSSRGVGVARGLSQLAHRGLQHVPLVSREGEESLTSGDDVVPISFCEGMLTTQQLVSTLLHASHFDSTTSGSDSEGSSTEDDVVRAHVHTTLRQLLKNQRAKKTLAQMINTCVEDACTVAEVMEAMVEHKVRSVLVVDSDDNIVGVVASHDIVRRVLLEDRVPGKVKASAIMTKGPATVDASKTILQTMKQFMDCPFHHLPILEEGSQVPVGVVSLTELVAAITSPEDDGEEGGVGISAGKLFSMFVPQRKADKS